MSQHYVFIESSNRVFMLGWDKPLQEAYMILGNLNADGDDWEQPLIIDAVIPFDRVNNIHYVDEIVISFSGRLEREGIELSKYIGESLIRDITENSVNKMWLHKPDNDCVPLEQSPFNSGLFSKTSNK